MQKLAIQRHIIDAIYEYIKSTANEVPEYVKFAYVADRYSNIKELINLETQQHIQAIENYKINIDYSYKESFSRFIKSAEGKRIKRKSDIEINKEIKTVLDSKYTETEIQNMCTKIFALEAQVSKVRMTIMKNHIPLFERLDQYEKKYQKCQTPTDLQNYYESNESTFCLPKDTARRFIAKQKALKIFFKKYQSVIGNNDEEIHKNKVEIYKFLFLNPLLVDNYQGIYSIITSLNKTLENLEVDEKEIKLNEIVEGLLKNRTFSDLLMELVHNIIKFITFGKFQPFAEETKIAHNKNHFQDYLEEMRKINSNAKMVM